MSRKVLIRKQSDAGGIVNYRNISERRPSALGLLSRLGDPTASGWQKINAGLNLAGKGAAAAVAANDTLQRLHGGNIAAPLTIGQTYASLDPSSMSGQTPQEQQRQMIQNRKDAQRQRKLNALTDLRISVGDTITNPQGVQQQLQQQMQSVTQPPAGLPAEPPVPAGNLPAGATPPGMGGTNFAHPYQAQWEAMGETGRAPPTFRGRRGPTGPPPAATQPATPNTPESGQGQLPTVDPILSQVTAQVGVPVNQQPPVQASGAQNVGMPNPQGFASSDPSASRDGSLASYTPPPVPSTPAPGYTPPQLSPAGSPFVPGVGGPAPTPQQLGQQPDNGLEEFQRTINPATGQPYPTLLPQQLGQQPDNGLQRSFATQVLDEFGDMLHKADPHVAGLLAFRVYMDKVLKG